MRAAPTPAPAPAEQQEDGRVVGGHAYLKSTVLDFAFDAPYVSSALEAALATVQVSGATSPLSTAALSPSFLGQFRLFKRVGVELGAQLAELGGTNAYSALVLGANFNYGASAAARIEVYRDDSFVLTPALFYSWMAGLNFSPLYAVNEAITTDAQARGSQFLTRTTTHELRPTLLAVSTIDPMFGIVAEAGIAYDFTLVGSDQNTTHSFVGGIAGDVSLNSLIGFPIGFLLSFRDNVPLNFTDTSSPLIGIGVFDTVSKTANFGAEFTRLLNASSSMALALSLTAYY